MPNLKSLFTIPSRTNHVKRFNGQFIAGHRSSISEHTFEVVFYCNLFCNYLINKNIINSYQAYNLLQYAISHDLPEVLTGDVPYTTKVSFPELKTTLDKVEEIYKTELDVFSKPSDLSKFICKLCDLLAVAREISIEVDLNNNWFTEEDMKTNCSNILIDNFNKYFSKLDIKTTEDCLNFFKQLIENTSLEFLKPTTEGLINSITITYCN